MGSALPWVLGSAPLPYPVLWRRRRLLPLTRERRETAAPPRASNKDPAMEETVGDPPTSAVLLDHCHFSQVVFNSVEKFYVPGGDVTCYYTLTEHCTPRRKDWIGIFRVSSYFSTK
ncbi:calcium-binding and coiled-coil domain-containing protein 2-like isoform X1 [Myotis lucifugus]|uniref:calcium-binding and coiled-coil domain-containing protein 2-like isoform X1 n=1 Tax=Myotis lucifugus TaxID=59463 RepID=UPI000CCBDF1F|nr:calcium-binding and coiled-coil domain-containing protein 2-like isoform X1 [Myotis lucifugus]